MKLGPNLRLMKGTEFTGALPSQDGNLLEINSLGINKQEMETKTIENGNVPTYRSHSKHNQTDTVDDRLCQQSCHFLTEGDDIIHEKKVLDYLGMNNLTEDGPDTGLPQ